jgi:hypothetical protein
MKASLKITGETQRAFAIQQLREMPLDPVHIVTIQEKRVTRSTLQNDKMWATLTDISQQVDWHGQKLPPEDWKCIFSAAIKKQRVVPGIDSGFVVMAQSTSKMTVSEMAELIELATAFGCQHGVKWHDPKFEDE